MKEDNSRHEITVKTLEQSDWEAELEEKTLDSQEEVGSCCHKTSVIALTVLGRHTRGSNVGTAYTVHRKSAL